MLNFSVSEEQAHIVDTVERALNSSDIKVFGETPQESWASISELAIPSMRVSSDRGGWDAGLFDAVLVAEAAGTQGRIDQVLPAIVAYGLCDRLGDPLGLLAGDLGPIALALHDVATYMNQLVLGADRCDRIVFRHGDKVLLAGYTSPQDQTLEPVARVDFGTLIEGARTLAEGADAIAEFERALCEYRLLVAAAQVGLGKQATADAGEYACERIVFGVPIGTYQGIAHMLANALTDVDGASLLVWRAVAAIGSQSPDAASLVSQACWWAHNSGVEAVRVSMRVFGGYGMSNDSRLPYYYRTARDAGLAFGDPDVLLDSAGEGLMLPVAGEVSVSFNHDDEALALAAKAEEFVAAQFPVEDRKRFDDSLDNHFTDLHQRLASAGLLYPDWPTEYGGSGASAFATSAARSVLGKAGWPLSVLVVSDMVGKLLMQFGTEEAKAEILPKLASGEAICCLGLSEPSGGSDVFGAKTRAIKNDDGWTANGQKVFTTSAHIASYVLLLARADATDNSSAGLTLFVAPVDRDGFEAHAVQTFAGERTNITFYSDFQIDDKYLLGEAGRGTKVLGATLNLEHNMGDYYIAALDGGLSELDEELEDLLQLPGICGNEVKIHHSIAKAKAYVALLECLHLRSMWAGENGKSERWFGSMCKLFGTEAWMTINAELVERFAPYSVLPKSRALFAVEAESRRGIPATIYGGTSEIQRSIIAESALSLPRSR